LELPVSQAGLVSKTGAVLRLFGFEKARGFVILTVILNQ